jgi:penicillin amidase
MNRLLPLLLLAAVVSPALAAPAPAVRQESRTLPGLLAPGSITIDHWGIPHIRAASPRDAFFLQGYAVARDRLWQIDLWRKRGLGRLAASFGPDFVAQDRASRLLLYRGDIDAEWAHYPAEARDWTSAFAAGINAFVEDVRAGRQPLPVEFTATRSSPENWTADDIVRIRSNALVSNLPSEVARARALCTGDPRYEPLRRPLSPAHTVSVPKGLDPCAIPADVLTDYNLGTGGVVFDGKTGITLAAAADPERQEGSNNWVISPGRSTTGRPILAGDPHRAHSVPSLRYVSHLEAPGLAIAGAGEPALPGVSFGHNADVGWALTIFYIDQQDLVVVPPGAAVQRQTETVAVAGAAAQPITLEFSADGPIIHTAADGTRFALRATWSQPGASAYFNASWAWRAQGWDDFLKARDRWGAPPLNLLFASRNGDIGWTAAGFAPDRVAGDGLVPVPTGPAHRWRGLLAPVELPTLFNPPAGWIATANAQNMPAGYRWPLGYEWADRSRIDRIGEVIGAKPKFGLVDAMDLQADITSVMARRYVAVLAGLTTETSDDAAALRLLASWDGRIGAESPAAALYQIWLRRHLPDAVVAAVVPAAARADFGRPTAEGIIDTLEGRNGLLAAADRAPLLRATLAAAWREAQATLGPDPQSWRWGNLHTADFVPGLAIPGLATARRVGPLPLGGDGSTVMAATPRADFGLAAGASVRMVLDVGAWDNSVIVNAPGQSGNADDAHYRDLFPIWAAGRHVPFRWSREAVDAVAERVITAVPR